VYSTLSKPILKIKDYKKDFENLVQSLRQKKTLVGIPVQDNSRPGNESPIGNAAIMFINNFGSPGQNIPPRPVFDIGMARVMKDLIKQFELIALAAVENSSSKVNQGFERLGVVASQSVKTVIDQQIDIAPPSFSTLKSRQARGFKGDKALVVTGQLRNSITYVVEG